MHQRMKSDNLSLKLCLLSLAISIIILLIIIKQRYDIKTLYLHRVERVQYTNGNWHYNYYIGNRFGELLQLQSGASTNEND